MKRIIHIYIWSMSYVHWYIRIISKSFSGEKEAIHLHQTWLPVLVATLSGSANAHLSSQSIPTIHLPGMSSLLTLYFVYINSVLYWSVKSTQSHTGIQSDWECMSLRVSQVKKFYKWIHIQYSTSLREDELIACNTNKVGKNKLQYSTACYYFIPNHQ